MAALDKITGMPALPVTSAFRESMPPAPKGYMGPKEYAPAEQELTSELTKATQKVGEADVEIEKAKREEKARELESKATGLQKFAQDIEQMPEKQMLKELREQQRGMEFIPTKDTAQDIAGLFSLIGVIGMVVGRGNAQQAMGAMNGMLEGHRKGRADLFKQQSAEFDKNFKAMQTKVSSALSEYQEALERKKTDKEAGELMAQAALARTESPLLKAMKDKQGDVAVVETLKQMLKSTTETAPKIINDLKSKSDDRAQKERHQRESLALREKLAKAAAELKSKGGALKPGGKITEGYVADTILRADVNALANDLQNPKLQEQIKKYRAEAFLTEESKVLNQMLTSDIPQELQQFLTKVKDIRNNYYLNISGKAVTGGEALRNYGTVPQPGDEPSVMQNKLRGMSDRIGDSISLKQQLFGLPELNLNPGTKPNLKPGDDYAIGNQPGKFEVGKVYTDDSGNKAKYLGNDEWEEQ